MKTKQTTGAAKFTSKRAAVIAFRKAHVALFEARLVQAGINRQLDTEALDDEERADLKSAREAAEQAEHVAYNKMFDIYSAAEKQGFYITTSLFGHNATRDLASANCD